MKIRNVKQILKLLWMIEVECAKRCCMAYYIYEPERNKEYRCKECGSKLKITAIFT